MRMLYGMPPESASERVREAIHQKFSPTMATTVQQIKDRIAQLEKELGQVEAWRHELATLKKMLAVYEPPPKPKRRGKQP